MGIKHSVTKAHGGKGLASEWNDDHVIDGAVDFDKNEAQNLTVHNLASPPANPSIGQLYYDTVHNNIYIWNGSYWSELVGPDSLMLAWIGL